MRELVERYISGLLPELDPDLLEMETISRSAYLRDDLEEAWDDLTEEERSQVQAADQVLIAAAPQAGHYWREDEVDIARKDDNPPQEHWWWWLDQIADGSYPAELLPEAVR